MFCCKSWMNILIDNWYCNWFIYFGWPILPMNYYVTSLCLQSQPHLGSRMHMSVLHLGGTAHPICDLSQIIATRELDALTVPLTHQISNDYIYFHSHLLAGTNSTAISLMTMKGWFFSQYQPQAIFLLAVVIAGDCAMTLAFHVLQIVCHIKYHYSLLPYLDVI